MPPKRSGATPRTAFDLTLYAIADAAFLDPTGAGRLLEKAIAGGVTAVQVRGKELTDKQFLSFASQLIAAARGGNVPAIVNDRIDIALVLEADGVHLGADDIPVPDARRLLGKERIIGTTAHSLAEVEEAADLGADYVGFGAIYPSPSKAVETIQGIDELRSARELTRLPLVAIGGITVERAAEVVKAGADGVAAISGLWGAGDPELRAREYIQSITRARAKT